MGSFRFPSNNRIPPQDQKQQKRVGEISMITVGDFSVVTMKVNLGTMYDKGQGVTQDYVEAEKWYRKAAELGNAEAQLTLSMRLVGKTESNYWLRKAAEQGNVHAQILLGLRYEFRTSAPPDYAEALKWFRKGAEQGDSETQFRLGVMYYVGHGVPQDNTEAMKWFCKAAEQGQASAQHALGVMYYNSEGVPQNLVKAHVWLNLAGARGYTDAPKLRDEVAQWMTSAQIAEAQRLAKEWKPKGRD